MENINLSTLNGKRNNNNCIGRKRSLALALKAELETEIEQEEIINTHLLNNISSFRHKSFDIDR